MTQKKFRRTMLAAILVPLTAFLFFFEYNDLGDSALMLYSLCVVFITLCLAFWVYWGFKSRLRPSTMFVVIGALFASLDYILISNIYARYQFVYNRAEYANYITKDFWSYRVSPELILFIWLFCWIGGRLFGEDGRMGMKGTKLKILIVEDDPSVGDLMESVIMTMNTFSVDRADSYKKALDLFVPEKYICCTIDLNLGKDTKEGVDLAWKFRQDDPDVYLAVISGYFNQIFEQRLLESVDDFLQKPFDINVFKLKIFLWAVKYRRRLLTKEYITGSDFQLKSEILQNLEEKLFTMFNTKTK